MSAILAGINDNKVLLTETVTYRLWENAGKKILEAQLTADQISQIFQTVQQDMTAAGGNRTMVGKGVDAASAVNKAWEDLKTKVQNSGPIKNVDAMYDQAAEKLKQATGGDQGVMKYVQMYRDFAKKHPIAQSLIYSALIAAAGISGAGLGGAAALGLFKMVDKLLQGEKFSSAAYSGAKTGAMAYGASKVGDLIRGQSAGQNELVGKSPEELDALAKDVPGAAAVSTNPVDALRGAMKAGEAAARSGANDYSSIMNAAAAHKQQLYDAGVRSPNLLLQAERAFVAGAKGELARAAGGTAQMVGGQLVKESVTLSESRIKLIFKHIENQHNLNEGLWDTVKGAAGKAVSGVVDYAKTKGQNLTTKVTADKLMQAWKKAGSPTDSTQVSALLTQNGVGQDVVTSVFNKLKIPTTATPTQQPAVKPAGITAPAPSSAVGQGVSQAQQPQVNPELQKRLALRKAGTPDFSAGLKEDSTKADELSFAFQQAKNITKKIKYDDTVSGIITEIKLLAEKYNIDSDSIEVAIRNVSDVQRQLEAAVYGLDEVFEDALKQEQYKDDVSENNLNENNKKINVNDLADELFVRCPNIVRQYGHEVVGDAIIKVVKHNKDSKINDLLDQVLLTIKKTNEGQIYSTGGGAGEGRRKYRIKPAGY